MTDVARAVVAMTLPLHRQAIVACLGSEVEVVGEAFDLDSARAVLAESRARLLIAEFRLAGGGPELCAVVKRDDELGGDVRVLIIGTHRDDHDDELVAAVHAGADGFVSEADGMEALRDGVRRVARGEASIPGAMLGTLLRTLIRDRREEDRAVERFSRLSMREREVVALICEGLDNAAIGERLFVSPNTARTHVQNILRKLDVTSRLEAASMVNTFGLLDRFAVVATEEP